MKKIIFHPHDLKEAGMYLALYRNGAAIPIPYAADGVYDEDNPIKTCNIVEVQFSDAVGCLIYVLDQPVIQEDTCEEIGTLCIIMTPEQAEKLL